MTDKDIRIEIKASSAQASKEIANLTKQIDKLSAQVKAGGRVTQANNAQMTRSFKSLTAHVSKLAIIYGTFKTLLSSTVITAQFEQSIKKLGVYSNATADDLELLEDKARALGESTMFSASQVADGMNEMALAGLKANDMLSGMGDILNLASVGMIDIKTATDFAVTSMKAFGLQSSDINDISDIFAKASTISATTVTELGQALSKVGQVAHAYNVSLEETSSALGVLADAGRRGSEAGTQLKIVMQRLAGNKEALKYLDELGISMYDANRNLLPFNQQLAIVKQRLSGMSEKARNIKLSQIFGSEASASAIALINNLDELNNKLEQIQGAMKDDYATQSAQEIVDTLVGSYKNLVSALEGLAIKIISEMTPALREMLDATTESIRGMDDSKVIDFADSLGALVETTTTVIEAMAGLAEITTGFLQDNNNLAMYVTTLVIGFRSLSPAIAGALTSMGALTATTMPFLAVVIALTGVFATYIDHIERHTTALDKSTALQDKNRKLFEQATNSIVSSLDRETGAIGRNNVERAKMASNIAKLQARLIKQEATMKQGALTDEEYAQAKALIRGQIESLDTALIRIGDSWASESDEVAKATAKQIVMNEVTADAVKNYQAFNNTLTKRVIKTSEAIDKILQKEQKLRDDIKKLEEEKAKIHADYANKRAGVVQDYDKTLYDARTKDLNDYKKYLSDKSRALALVEKADRALQQGKLEEATMYYSEAKALAQSFAGEQIKSDKAVLVASKTTLKEASKIFADTKKGEIAILKEKEKAELDANAMKMKLVVVELKAQLQQLKVQEELIKALRTLGKEAKANIANFDNITVFDEAKQALKDLIAEAEQANPKIKPSVDGTKGLNDFKNQVDGMTKRYVPRFNAKVETDEETIARVQRELEANPVKQKIEYNADKSSLNDAENVVEQSEPVASVSYKPDTKDLVAFEQTLKTTEIQATVGANVEPAIVMASTAMAKISGMTATTITDSNASPALATASQAVSRINQMKAYIDVYANYHSATGGYIPKGAPQHLAEGGVFTGSGRVAGYDPTDSDSVSAKLTGGEFVVKREAVDAYGLSLLYAINNMKFSFPKGYATGGEVGRSSNTVTPTPLTPVNLHLGGNKFGMQAPQDVVDAVISYINSEGGM